MTLERSGKDGYNKATLMLSHLQSQELELVYDLVWKIILATLNLVVIVVVCWENVVQGRRPSS
jgi:hypothetical protein